MVFKLPIRLMYWAGYSDLQLVKKYPLLIILGSFAIIGLSVSSWAFTYVIKDRDNLSKVAEKFVKGPVWGKNGSLKKILDLNLHIKNPDFILPGEKIVIDDGWGAATDTPPNPEKSPIERNVAAESTSKVTIENTLVKPKAGDENETPVHDKKEDTTTKSLLFQSGTTLELTSFYSFTNILATSTNTGAESQLASNLFTGVDIAGFQNWTETSRSFVHLKVSHISFEPPTDSTSTLSNSTKTMTTFGVGGSFDLKSKLNFKLFADVGKELFLRSTSTTNLTTDTVGISTLGASLSYDLFQKDSFTLGLSGRYEKKLAAKTSSYEIMYGKAYGGNIYLKQEFSEGKIPYQIDLGYYERRQDTSYFTQKQNDIVLSIIFFLPINRKDEKGY
jgi:hypothetical protein